MPQKWEYCEITVDFYNDSVARYFLGEQCDVWKKQQVVQLGFMNIKIFSAALIAKLGNEGWEMVNFSHMNGTAAVSITYVFKRSKQVESPTIE